MEQRIHLTGQMPDRWELALAELREELGMAPAGDGIEIACEKGENLAVESDGARVRLTWAEPIQFYRALSLIPLPLAPCSIQYSASCSGEECWIKEALKVRCHTFLHCPFVISTEG